MLTMRGRPSANTVPETCARLLLGRHRHGDQALVVALGLARHLLDHDAALLGDDRRGDDVDVLQHRPQQAGDRGRGQRLGVHLRHRALVGDLHLGDAGLGELAGERAELLGERDERLEPRRLLGGDRGEVDRVGDRAAQQIVRHLLGDLQRDVLLRLGGGGAEMRRAHHVGHGRTADCCVAGSSTNTSKAAPATWPDLSAVAQRRLVDQAAARAIDDAHALLHLRRSPRRR